ncbi:hypothetical protein FHG87_000779 [Trinorchestia longiramus]|nr:hypothetical protein FHG87_000779 [Trinorchestia longiramus]
MSSYASLEPSGSDFGYYDDNYDSYAYDVGTSDKDDKGAGEVAAITIASIAVPAVVVVIIAAIIIAILVELKHIDDAVAVGVDGRAVWGWFDSISSAINEVDSDSLLRRMFPGGFSSVIHSIEKAYTSYRGFDIPRAKKPSINKQKQKKAKSTKN